MIRRFRPKAKTEPLVAPSYTFNQQSYSRYSSNRPNKQNLNSKFIAKKRIIKGNAKFSQGNSNLSVEKCTCDHPIENVQKKFLNVNYVPKNLRRLISLKLI